MRMRIWGTGAVSSSATGEDEARRGDGDAVGHSQSFTLCSRNGGRAELKRARIHVGFKGTADVGHLSVSEYRCPPQGASPAVQRKTTLNRPILFYFLNQMTLFLHNKYFSGQSVLEMPFSPIKTTTLLKNIEENVFTTLGDKIALMYKQSSSLIDNYPIANSISARYTNCFKNLILLLQWNLFLKI